MAKSNAASSYCFGLAKSTVAGSSLSLLVLTLLHAVAECQWRAWAGLYGRTCTVPVRLVVPGRHAKKSKNSGIS